MTGASPDNYKGKLRGYQVVPPPTSLTTAADFQITFWEEATFVEEATCMLLIMI